MSSKQLIGKTKEQVLARYGNNYEIDFGGDIWVYTLKKTWFRRKNVLIIEFDYDGTVINVDKVHS